MSSGNDTSTQAQKRAAAEGRAQGLDIGWTVFSYLLAGMAAYGAIGWLIGRAVHVSLLFPHDGPALHAEPRRDSAPGRPGPDPPPVAGPERRFLPAVPRVALLLHLHHERDGADPGPPVPGHVQDRLRLADGVHRLLPLSVPGRQAPGRLGLPQEHDPAGRAGADLHHPGPGRAAQVLRLPAVHPRGPALREHDRRPPAADDLHARVVVPAEPVGRAGLRRGLLRAGDLRLPAGD